MKKTTIILGAAIAIALISAFLSPLLFLKKDAPRRDITINMAGSEESVELPAHISAIEIKSPDGVYYENYVNGLYIEIEESDSIADPVFTTDKSWFANMKIKTSGDRLSISMPMTAIKSELGDDMDVMIPQDSYYLGHLTVPRNSIHEISSPYVAIHLKSFRDAHLTLKNSHNLEVSDCSFASMDTD